MWGREIIDRGIFLPRISELIFATKGDLSFSTKDFCWLFPTEKRRKTSLHD